MQPMLNIAVRAARAAGSFIARSFEQVDQIQTEQKGADDFVTNIDREAERLIIEVLTPAWVDGRKHLNDVIENNRASADAATHDIVSAVSTAKGSMMISLLLAIVAAGICGLLLMRAISAPMQRIVHALDRLRSGDLSMRLSLDRKDEFGAIESGFNEMAEALANLAIAQDCALFTGFNRRYLPAMAEARAQPLTELNWQKHRFVLPGKARDFMFDDFIHVLDSLCCYGGAPTGDLHAVLRRSSQQPELLAGVSVAWQSGQVAVSGSMNRSAGLTEERQGVFAAAVAILLGLFTSLPIDRMEYSDGALREGLLYEFEERLQHHDIRERTALALSTHYRIDKRQANRVEQSVLTLFDALSGPWEMPEEPYRAILGWAARLHEIGLAINYSGIHRHSAYILQNTDLPGFNQDDQALLAALVRCHRKGLKLSELPALPNHDEQTVLRCIRILRLAVAAHHRRQDNLLPEWRVQAAGDQLVVTLPIDWCDENRLLIQNLEKEHRYCQEQGWPTRQCRN